MRKGAGGEGGPVPSHGDIPYVGGWHYQSFLLSMWEQFIGIAFTLGILTWVPVS